MTPPRLGRLLRDTAGTGHAVSPGPAPRSLPQPPARKRGPAEALAAADFVERLPEGNCSLDLEGRFTHVSATAAALLGGSVLDLIGAHPWQSLPWCTDPALEDQHRAAVVSREPGSYTAMPPQDRWLAFELYPDGSGVTAGRGVTR
ncbi:PAS domain-containing protein [Streptomyces mirabilis]|uniref:PAS domain-containing protein n=1 Tax=Streptomyces mirabilis TaxID=68239 RepID=UPI0036E49CB6